jgi:hypothetical protein
MHFLDQSAEFMHLNAVPRDLKGDDRERTKLPGVAGGTKPPAQRAAREKSGETKTFS